MQNISGQDHHHESGTIKKTLHIEDFKIPTFRKYKLLQEFLLLFQHSQKPSCMISYNIIFPSPHTSITFLKHEIRTAWCMEQHTVLCLISSHCTNRHTASHTWRSTFMYLLPNNNRTLRNKHVIHNEEIFPSPSSKSSSNFVPLSDNGNIHKEDLSFLVKETSYSITCDNLLDRVQIITRCNVFITDIHMAATFFVCLGSCNVSSDLH
jgi:hypothetical protein